MAETNKGKLADRFDEQPTPERIQRIKKIFSTMEKSETKKSCDGNTYSNF